MMKLNKLIVGFARTATVAALTAAIVVLAGVAVALVAKDARDAAEKLARAAEARADEASQGSIKVFAEDLAEGLTHLTDVWNTDNKKEMDRLEAERKVKREATRARRDAVRQLWWKKAEAERAAYREKWDKWENIAMHLADFAGIVTIAVAIVAAFTAVAAMVASSLKASALTGIAAAVAALTASGLTRGDINSSPYWFLFLAGAAFFAGLLVEGAVANMKKVKTE